MKSNKKQITESKQLKTKKKILQKAKEPEIDLDFETTSMNYFRIIKELEKQNMDQKLSNELTKKEPKPKQKNLTEKIYINNSKKLGNYYNKNKNDLLLYGSSKFDVLTVDKLVDEMGNYKSKVINKINENHNKNKKIKNSEIVDIIDDYDSSHNKIILTPLAENEKERSEMETLEKKKFDEAKRIGVVMRRIEYTYLLNNKLLNVSKNGDNKEMLNKLKTSVDKIEKCWLRYRKRKTKRMKENAKKGHIEIEILCSNDNIKKLEELKKSYNLLKIEKDRLDGDFKELQILYEEKGSDKDEELNGLREKYDEKLKEFETLNLTYNELLTEKNLLKENYDKLSEEKNLLDDKNNEMSENCTKASNELNNIKSEYESMLKQNSEKDEKIKELEEKIKELEEKIDSVNKEKNDFENDNKLLKDKISNLDGEFDNFKKTKTFQDSENENKLKQIEENFNKEKEDLNKNIIELQNDINEKSKEIEEQKNIINDYEGKYKELETKYNDMSQLKQDTENDLNKLKEEKNEMENEINKLKEDINTKETEMNKLNEEKNGKDDEINKLKGEIEEKDNEIKKTNLLLEESKNKNDEYQKEIDSLKLNMSNSAETDKIKINELEKEKNTLNNQINKLEEEKNDLKDTSNILESLISESREKYTKLLSQSKAKISKLNKEKEKLNEEIINLKNENLALKANNNEKDNVNDMEKKYNYEIIKENNNYEKKINRLNKVIEELNNRIQVLYLELANKENNNNINKENTNEPIKE